jgi:hypothetical protein
MSEDSAKRQKISPKPGTKVWTDEETAQVFRAAQKHFYDVVDSGKRPSKNPHSLQFWELYRDSYVRFPSCICLLRLLLHRSTTRNGLFGTSNTR